MLMNSLSIIVRQCRIFCERSMQEYDLGFPEQIVLMYLSQNNPINQDNIAQHFMVDKGAIAKTTNKLEEKSLISRIQNPENKRENLISLTAQGQEMLEYMSNILDEWNKAFFEGLSEEEISSFQRISELVAANSIRVTNKK